MKTKYIIKKIARLTFVAVAIVGVFAAVCVTDGSPHEMEIRVLGACAFFGGLVIASLFDERAEQ